MWCVCFCAAVMDVAGRATEGAAGWCVRWISGGGAGSHQTLWPAAANHAAGYSQCHQRRGGSHSAAQVHSLYLKTCSLKHLHALTSRTSFIFSFKWTCWCIRIVHISSVYCFIHTSIQITLGLHFVKLIHLKKKKTYSDMASCALQFGYHGYHMTWKRKQLLPALLRGNSDLFGLGAEGERWSNCTACVWKAF